MKTLTDFFYIDWNNANYLINWSLKNKIIYVFTLSVIVKEVRIASGVRMVVKRTRTKEIPSTPT